LGKIAESQGLKPSELARQIIIQYIDQAGNLETQAESETVKGILDNAMKKMESVVNYTLKQCEEFANEVVSNHPNEDRNYWKNDCLKRRRGMTREKLLELIRIADQELGKIIPEYNKRSELIRPLYQIVDRLMTRLL
jgi:metal-responsive CopG/Arc/MetJ family transcriptional regulator